MHRYYIHLKILSMANNQPYASLGKHLKAAREKAKLSLAEVSGAIEIDETELKKIEEGLKRPDEDLMILLFNYFNMADQEANQLWELGNYDTQIEDHIEFDALEDDNEPSSTAKTMVMLLAMEPKTMYSDGVQITWNKAGLTMEFSQANSRGKIPVAKVGMSLAQANEVYKCLEKVLLQVKYGLDHKLLPPSDEKPKK